MSQELRAVEIVQILSDISRYDINFDENLEKARICAVRKKLQSHIFNFFLLKLSLLWLKKPENVH